MRPFAEARAEAVLDAVRDRVRGADGHLRVDPDVHLHGDARADAARAQVVRVAHRGVGRDEAEKLVGAFYDMTDKWLKPSKADVPMEAVEKFRQQFNKVPRARKVECLQRALNLLPDDNIMLLAGILLDKEQPEECLELVYNDILNRDESVKKPLLLEIYKDKEHPCWSNTAWILDATGETPGK